MRFCEGNSSVVDSPLPLNKAVHSETETDLVLTSREGTQPRDLAPSRATGSGLGLGKSIALRHDSDYLHCKPGSGAKYISGLALLLGRQTN